MFRTIVLAAVMGHAVASTPALAQTSEHAEVAREACGPAPQAKCLAELRKVCHDHFTFRCYYSRKDRLDAIRDVGFPEDHVRVLDE